MQARRIARELALLSVSQLPHKSERLATQEIQNVVIAAVRTLSSEVQDALETAATELQRSSDRLLSSETRASDVQSARAMVTEAIELTQTALNRLGMAIDLPELVQLSNQQDVRDYSIQLLSTLHSHQTEIEQLLSQSLVDWQVGRLAQVDRNILRIAVAEIIYLDLPPRIAINEAVELAKRYSSEDGHRFVNGVLRRVLDQIRSQKTQAQ
jgi:transcription antitermination protein NusB